MYPLKSLSDTRWSVHASATKVLCYNYSNIQRSLIDLSEDDNQNLSTCNEARVLSKQMDKLKTALLCKYWNCVLQRFDATSIVLQNIDLDLSKAVDLVASLMDFVAELRGQFDSFETAAKEMSPTISQDYKSDSQRKRTRKKHADEPDKPHQDFQMSGRQKFIADVFYGINYHLIAELDRRSESNKEITNFFNFLNNIHTLSDQELSSSCVKLQQKCQTDLQEDFADEFVHFKAFWKKEKMASARELLR